VNKAEQERKQPKILVIEDDCLFLEVLVDLLDENGFQAIGTQNSLLGLQLVEAQMPDLMICDIRMPKFDGYDVLKKLRQDPVTQKIPFIIITAEKVDSDRSLAKKLGADDYLTKPFTTEQLLQAIQAQLQ
jgi:CheY-like chemotaxis protein